jgi:hypothetical protein
VNDERIAIPPIVLRSEGEVRAALADEALVPPPASIPGGPTRRLRSQMARFSAPIEHADRRAAVEEAIAAIDLPAAARAAAERTRRRIARWRAGTDHAGSERVELLCSIARPVAVETVAVGLGAADDSVAAIVGDIDAIVDVIGRGRADTAASDDAVDRLTQMFDHHPLGPVAVVSALYQSMDATAALVATRLVGGGTVPVARTTRVATSETDAAGTPIAAGSRVDVEIGAAGIWFGAGPHACPGRALAETIAEATIDAIVASGATVDAGRTELDIDGRPVAVWLCPGPTP